MNTKLTIAIPTYNRKNELKKCLDSLLPQIVDGVRILITDNASTDGTEDLIKTEYNYPFLTYHRNKENYGMDGNFLNCFRLVNEGYVQLLSDDDVLVPGTINAVLQYVEEEPALVFLKSGTQRDLEEIKDEKCSRFDNAEAYLKHVGIWFTFLSSLVVKRNLVDITNAEKYMGTSFMQVYMYTTTFLKSQKIILRETPSVVPNSEFKGGYGLYTVWFGNYKNLLLNFEECGVSKAFLTGMFREGIKGPLLDFVKCFRFKKGHFGFLMNGKWKAVKATWMYREAWIHLYPYMFFPKCIMRKWMRRKRKTRK